MFKPTTRACLSPLRLSAVLVLALAGVAFASSQAAAATIVCVPEKASTSVLSASAKNECPAKTISKREVKYATEKLPSPAELELLAKILPHVSYIESGVGARPTIQFSAVNVQIVSGAGKTSAAVNGEGNLVIGYDENPKGHAQTGSHDLILGEEQTFTSFGGIDAGKFNTISGEFASVTGGSTNTASAIFASVSGGAVNTASGTAASVTAGEENTASAKKASITGGKKNVAAGIYTSISGGEQNFAGPSGDIFTEGRANWVGGGFKNKADSEWSAIFGGKELETGREDYEAIP
jgi:hypothetical protein